MSLAHRLHRVAGPFGPFRLCVVYVSPQSWQKNLKKGEFFDSELSPLDFASASSRASLDSGSGCVSSSAEAVALRFTGAEGFMRATIRYRRYQESPCPTSRTRRCQEWMPGKAAFGRERSHDLHCTNALYGLTWLLLARRNHSSRSSATAKVNTHSSLLSLLRTCMPTVPDAPNKAAVKGTKRRS